MGFGSKFSNGAEKRGANVMVCIHKHRTSQLHDLSFTHSRSASSAQGALQKDRKT